MITKIKINNFKSIQKTDEIEMKPLTIITGPNASGKSNLLEGISVFAQRARLNTGPFTLQSVLTRGDLFVYPKINYVAYRKELGRPIEFKVEFELPPDDRIKFEEASQGKYIGTRTRSLGYEFSFVPESNETIQKIFLGGKELVETRVAQVLGGASVSKFEYPQALRKYRPRKHPYEILDSEIFGPIEDAPQKRRYQLGQVMRLSRLAISILLRLLSRVFFVSALRGAIALSPKTTVSPDWVGKNGENTLDLLALIFSKREYNITAEAISSWAQKFGLDKIGGGWWGGDTIGVDYIDPKIKKDLELALASHGNRQVLSIITQLLWMQQGEVLMVEEPEISLHPQHQVVLQELFGTIASEGKQIICTTHSPIFILGLSRVVKNRILSPDDIQIIHTEKTEVGTKFTTLQLTKEGYVKGWIPSFIGIEDKLMEEWSEAIGG